VIARLKPEPSGPSLAGECGEIIEVVMSILNFLYHSLLDRESSPQDVPAYQKAIERKDYVAAIPLLHKAIRADDASAMAFYGSLISMGLGIEADIDEAVVWFRQSAVRGNPYGQAFFASCLAMGAGVPKDTSEAAFWLFKAAKLGHPHALDRLADLVMEDPSVVGKHFTMEEFRKFWRAHKTPRMGAVH
jgi:TPR repeat protein